MDLILGTQIWVVVKVLFLIAGGIYVLFSLVVVRQVQLMLDTLEVGFEMPIRLIAVAHLIVAVAVFVLALLTL